jgi:phage-related protein (TIGR01555 family)
LSTAKSKVKRKTRKLAKDTATETLGIRGAGATSQATFGEAIDLQDLLFAVQREPVAHRVVFGVAHDTFDKWFKVEEVADKPDENFPKAVETALSTLNAKSVFTQASIYERLTGWAIIIIGYVDHGKSLQDPVTDPSEVSELVAYAGDMQVTVQTSDEEKDPNNPRFGLPNLYTINRTGIGQEKIHWTRVIHFATRLLDHAYEGLSVLDAIYDDLTALRNIRWGMGQTLFRYGSGFPDITLEGATPKQVDDFIAGKQMESVNARTFFVHSQKQTLEFKGLAGRNLDPEPYYTPIMENISAGTGIPLAILRGAQAGALTGSDVNEREYFKVISACQSRYESGIWQLIDLLMETGQIPTVEDYNVKWLGGFELNELDKAQIALAKAQANDLKTKYMTVNELRALQEPSLQALKGPEGEVIPGLQKPPAPQTPPSGPPTGFDAAKKPSFYGKILLKLKGEKHEKNGNSSG